MKNINEIIDALPEARRLKVIARAAELINEENAMQHDFILLDRSGSMSNIWSEAVSSINAYVKKLADDRINTGVTLATFDTNNGAFAFEIIRDKVHPGYWPVVSAQEAIPRGMTPLNDATGRIVNLAMAGNYEKVAIIIMTDGFENASRELNVTQAKNLLDACRAKNWQVIFLGANFDNAVQAVSYGSAPQFSTQIAPGQFGAAAMSMNATRADYAATGAAMGFSNEEKRKLAGK